MVVPNLDALWYLQLLVTYPYIDCGLNIYIDYLVLTDEVFMCCLREFKCINNLRLAHEQLPASGQPSRVVYFELWLGTALILSSRLLPPFRSNAVAELN